MVDTFTNFWKIGDQIAAEKDHHLPVLKAGGRVPSQVGHSSKDSPEATQGHLTQYRQEDQALDVLESMKDACFPLR